MGRAPTVSMAAAAEYQKSRDLSSIRIPYHPLKSYFPGNIYFVASKFSSCRQHCKGFFDDYLVTNFIFEQGPICLDGHLNCFKEIGSRLFQGPPLCICSRQFFNIGDVAQGDLFKNRCKL